MKKILAIFLTVLFLAGNMGFTVINHYCGGEVMESAIAIGYEDIDCGMEEMESACDNLHGDGLYFQNDCCKDEVIALDIADDYVSSTPAELPDVQFAIAFVVTSLQLIDAKTSQNSGITGYSPPYQDADIQVLYQTFLI